MSDSWIEVPLGRIFSAVGGGTPSTEEPAFWNGPVPWITSADIGEDFRLTPRRSVTESGLLNSAASAVPRGSVVVATRVGLGKVGLVQTEQLAFSQDCQALLPTPGIHERYLAYQVQWIARDFRHESRGTTISGITKKSLNAALLVIPPSREQGRIADALDELFSDLDAGVAALERARAKLALYRASVLKAAVEGSLTAGWRAEHPDAEPASRLLERILAERRRKWEDAQLARFKERGKTPPKGWRSKYKEPVAPDFASLPALPDGWCWASLDQLGQIITGSTPTTADAANFGPGLPFVKPTDLGAGCDLRSARESLSAQGASHARVLDPPSVLVTCIGATIGKSALAHVRCATNQQINAIVPQGPSVSAAFLYWYIVSPDGQSQIVRNSSATTLPILNKSRFGAIAVPVPPLDEQAAMVDEVDRQVSVLGHLDVAVVQRLTEARTLRHSILRHAFSGKLVPQDPNDEPASELLERIAAEREAKPALSKEMRRPAKKRARMSS